MARPRKPMPLQTGHRTKEEKDRRAEAEPKVPFIDVSPPGFLPKRLHPAFEDLAKKLVAVGIFTELDEATLARYLIADENYQHAVADMSDADADDLDDDVKAKRQNRVSKSIKDCRDLASDLGLTITSRCKIELPSAADDDGGYNL